MVLLSKFKNAILIEINMMETTLDLCGNIIYATKI